MKKGKKWKKIEAFCILLIVTLLLIFVRILYQPGTESERGDSSIVCNQKIPVLQF